MASRIIIFSIIAIIVIASIIGLFFYNLIKGHREWKNRVKNTPVDRAFKTKQNFIDHYVVKGYSVNSINFVYDQTQKFLKATDMVLLPSDNLISLYERQENEWTYAIQKWFKELGRQQPDQTYLNNLLAKHKEISFEYLIDLVETK